MFKDPAKKIGTSIGAKLSAPSTVAYLTEVQAQHTTSNPLGTFLGYHRYKAGAMHA
jgi:hypothetical protein